ncbi:hypothetical protein BGX38DRAFT_1197032 [Terfezia claveryi]|nr:hypothetical protein BGX38DRAFT_1197032 [Terfezia claveryi]
MRGTLALLQASITTNVFNSYLPPCMKFWYQAGLFFQPIRKMSTGREIFTVKEVSAKMDGSPQKKNPTWKHYTFLVLLSICLITLFTISIWKTITDLEAQRELNCETIKGNSDMYGLGIRLGVYMQLTVSAFMDSFGNQAYSAGLVPSTLWFLLALSVALSMVLYDSNTRSSEVYIIIILGNAVMTIMLSKMIKFNPLKSTESYLLFLGRLLLWGIWRASTSVYWFTLLHSYVRGSESCGTWGWIFFKVDLYGSFRTFHQVINVVGWVTLGCFLLAYSVGAIIFCYCLCRINLELQKGRHAQVSKFSIFWDYLFVSIGQLRQTMYGVNEFGVSLSTPCGRDDEEGRNANANPTSSKMDRLRIRLQKHIEAHYTKKGKLVSGSSDSGAKGSRFGYWVHRDKILEAIGFKEIKVHLLLIWDITIIAYTILNVEFSIRMNNFVDVYDIWSIGQLIPVIIGAGGIGSAAAELYVYAREKMLDVNWAGSVGVTGIGDQDQDSENETPEESSEETHDNETHDKKAEISELEK